LRKEQAEAFLTFNEELLGRRVKERVARLYPDLRTKVFCSGLRDGSLEFLLNIEVATFLGYVGGAVTFIANYSKLKKGIKDIVSDIEKMGSWAVDACANTFDWVTVGHPEDPVSEQSSDDVRAKLFDEVTRAVEKLRTHDEKKK
jgi:hypothetical protein